MKDAKHHLRHIADAFFTQSAEAHIKGMTLARTSARIEQLARILTESESDLVLAALIEEGSVCLVAGEYELVDVGDAGVLTDIQVTSRGGDS